jgi:hypothetical protein
MAGSHLIYIFMDLQAVLSTFIIQGLQTKLIDIYYIPVGLLG